MKKNVPLLLLLFLTLLIVSCASIEDLNGEDTHLSQITTDELYGQEVGWSASNLKKQSYVDHAGMVPADYYAAAGFTEAMDKDYYRLECGSASGTTNLVGIRLEARQDVTLVVESEIREGNLEIVLLKHGEEANEFLYQFETNTVDVYKLSAEEFGIYYVRAGVESFAGMIEVNRGIGED